MRYAIFMVMVLLVPSPIGLLPWRDMTVPVPDDYLGYIEADMQEIVSRGWGVIGHDDLYHGHILLDASARERRYFTSFEDVLSYAVGALYHTDESTARWNAERDREPGERTPRSIVSIWDSGLFPAVLLVPDAEQTAWNYTGYGTITAWDLYRARPDLFFDDWQHEIRFSGSRCMTVLQFNVMFNGPVSGGITVFGRRYGLTFSCRPGWPQE